LVTLKAIARPPASMVVVKMSGCAAINLHIPRRQGVAVCARVQNVYG
jgi:hypothetical protein